MIFYGFIHINWNLDCFLANQVAEKLNIDILYDEKAMEEVRKSWYLKTNEYVYPCVAKALEMDFVKDMAYVSKRDGGSLSDRELVEELIEFLATITAL